jgi:hypothetical protein
LSGREVEVVGRKVAALVPPEGCDHIDVSVGSPSTSLSWYMLRLPKTEDRIEKVERVSVGSSHVSATIPGFHYPAIK